MAKKYNKITREDVLKVFVENKIVNRKMICDKYNCSVYSVRWHIDDLIDEDIIRNVRYGYELIRNNK